MACLRAGSHRQARTGKDVSLFFHQELQDKIASYLHTQA